MTLDEIDALAAEKIMGWECRGGYWGMWLGAAEPLQPVHFYCPTRSIAQAFMLLEKLLSKKEENGEPLYFPVNMSWDCGTWEVQIWKEDLRINHQEISNSLPEAITRACLAAKGIEL